MARTEHILTACEQLHPTICLLDKAHVLQECSASGVIYSNKYNEKPAAYTCRLAYLFQVAVSLYRIMS